MKTSNLRANSITCTIKTIKMTFNLYVTFTTLLFLIQQMSGEVEGSLTFFMGLFSYRGYKAIQLCRKGCNLYDSEYLEKKNMP